MDGKVGEMIANEYQPLAIVDSKGFRRLTNSLERYQIPSIKYFSEIVIPDIAEKIRVKNN